MTFVWNTTAAVAAYRIAILNGVGGVMPKSFLDEWMFWKNSNDGDDEEDDSIVVDESVAAAVAVSPVVTATTTVLMENTSQSSPSPSNNC